MANKPIKTIWQTINWKKINYWKTITYVIYFFVIIFAFTAILSKFSIGGIKLLTVQSGSMEPAIRVGSLVFVKSRNAYQINDIITYKDREDSLKTTTHRIINKEYTGIERYTTKGDANDVSDSNAVLPPQIIGKVAFSVPYFGYPVAFARTLPGLIVLIIVPAVIIIYDEILKIKTELAKRKKSKKGKNA